jgi:HPt (histidine-containing phosphotransfer) domain-containing protein
MPVMSGMEAVESLRANGYAKPIIAMTANAMRGDQEHYLQIGCDDYVAKPIDKTRFRQTLERYLSYQPETESVQIVSNMLKEEPDLIDILAKFVATLPETLHNIEQAAENNQWEELARLVHALKGTGGGYGYPQLTETCQNIEKCLSSSDIAGVKQQIDTLATIIQGINLGLKKSA